MSILKQENHRMHQYWGFGLNIASDIEFPELLPSKFEGADVTISLTGHIDEPAGEREAYTDHISVFNPSGYYLDIKGVARYYATGENMIRVAPYPGIDGRSVRLFILGTIMAYILFRKGLVPLHASGIILNDKLTLFTGDSGAGKSTTIAQLALRGYDIFTDDVCVINKEGRGVASYPMIKLWDDAVVTLDDPAFSDKGFKIRPGMDKYGYFFYDRFHTYDLPIDTIFVIRADKTLTEPVYSTLTGHRAFDALAQQVYRRYLIIGPELKTLYFKTVSALADACRVVEIRRPESGDPALFIDMLESLF